MTARRAPADLRANMLRELALGPVPLSEMCGRMSYHGRAAYELAASMANEGAIVLYVAPGKGCARTRTVTYAALPGDEPAT